MMQEDQNEMIRYFSDFLTEINIIITNIKDYVYEIIDVNLTPSKTRTVFQSMSSIILATHKTYDDLKKIESILTGVIKSKRITNRDQSVSSKKRSKTTYSRFEFCQQKMAKTEKGFQQVRVTFPSEANEAKTIKRKMISKNEIKQVLQRSASSEQQVMARNKNENNNKTEDNMTVKHSVQRGMQHSCSQIVLAKNIHSSSEQRIRNIVKHNGVSLSKIMETNNECLRIVRSAKKQLKSKK